MANNITGDKILDTQKTTAESRNNAFSGGGGSGSPLTAQMKKRQSLLNQTEITFISDLSGSMSKTATGIAGDVSDAISRVSATSEAALEVGSVLGGGLESSGIVSKVATKSISSAVSQITEGNKKGINRAFTSNAKSTATVVGNRDMVSAEFVDTVDESIRDKRRSILGTDDLGYEGASFPTDVADAEAFMGFRTMKYSRPNPQSQGRTSTKHFIYLPLPDNFAETFNIRLDAQDVGPIMGKVADSITAQGGLNSESMSATAGNILSGLRDAVGSKEAITEIAQLGAYDLAGGIDPALGGVVGQLIGGIPNPHPSIMFKGVDLRTFTWSWKLVPRDADEAKSIRQIVKLFKETALPEKDGGWLNYPDMVEPMVLPVGGLTEVKFKKCMIQNLTVNYSGEGTSAFFHDGHPVSIILTITFQEIEMYTKKDL